MEANTPRPATAPLATWAVFPLLLAAVIAATLFLLDRQLPPPLVSLSVLFGSVVVMLILERLAPLHGVWNRAPDAVDLMLIVGNRLVDVAVIAATTGLLAALQRQGVTPALLRLWPVEWPLLAQAALGIGLAELVRYTMHRLSHRAGLLGRIHHVHHQPRRMYTLNGPRLHPGNQLWITIANVVPDAGAGRQPAGGGPGRQHHDLLRAVPARQREPALRRPEPAAGHPRRPPPAPPARRTMQSAPVNFGIVLLLLDRLMGTYAPARVQRGLGRHRSRGLTQIYE